MRKLLFAIMACLPLLGIAATDTLKQMRLMSPVKVRRPLTTDSVSTKGYKPNFEKLLMQTDIPMSDERDGAVELVADTAGYINLPAGEGNNIYLLTTRLRADRFTTAYLRVKSPARFEIYVDGQMRRDKMRAQDSLHRAEGADVQLRMEPQRMYKVAVKVLVTETDSFPPAVMASLSTGNDTITQIACEPALKERYLLPNTIYGSRVEGVSISPDGRYLLTTYLHYYNQQRHNRYPVLSETKSGKTVVTFPAGYKILGWTPLTSQLFYKATSAESESLITINPATLQETVITDNLPSGNCRWSPDEKSLYFTITEQLDADKGPVHRLLSRSDRVPNSRNRGFIWRYDIESGVRERLTWGLRSTSLCDISNDGAMLLYASNEAVDNEWPFTKTSLYCLNVNTLEVDTLVEGDGFISTTARFSPDASQIVVTGGPEAFGGIGKNCGQHPIANNYDTQAYVINRADGSVEAISKDFNPALQLVQWNKNDGCIYFKTNDCDAEPIYRYNPAKKSFDKLPLNGDCVRTFSLARNASVAAYISITASSSQAAYMCDVRKGKSTLIADPYAEELEGIELGTIHDWEFTASDGTTIDCYYCLPPAFDANKKYPLIVYYYGGTTPTTRGMDNPYAAQLFSSRDYVTLVVNPSGTIGYGQEFSARHVNAWGKRTADDIIEGTKAFCAANPFVDAEHIGCLGASYGGFMTQYLQTQTDIFAAAASHAGISDVTSYWGEGYWGVGYNAVAAAQNYPWNNPDLFTKQGSLFNADKINTPLLLLHGTADTNVPVGESIQLYNALRVLGKTVEFIRVDGEDHFIADVPKRILWHNSIMAWFERWLKNDARWWNDIYPQRMIK